MRIIIISYLKLYNCVQIIGISKKYLDPYNSINKCLSFNWTSYFRPYNYL